MATAATTKSKMFRVFVAGQTISDGREIKPEWIDQIAETFNPENYSPRVNVEHISGFSPEPPFNGYGTVCAVEARTDAFTIDGKTEQRRCLYAQVDANDQLVQLAKADQKPFPSVELTDSYAGTDKVGMVGLAFTDTPASVGTQRLQFSRSAPGTHFAVSPDRVTIEFEPKAEPVSATGIADAIAAGVARAFAKLTGQPAPEKKQEPKPQTPPANDNDPAAFAAAIGASFAAALQPLAEANAKVTADLAALTGKLEKTEQPGGFHRAPTPGGNGGKFDTDC